MRELIGLPFKDCKGSNPSDFSKFIKNKLTMPSIGNILLN